MNVYLQKKLSLQRKNNSQDTFMLNQQLNIKLQQKLSPLQIQVIKMLEYPVMMLDKRIQEELEVNPALEAGDTPLDNGADSVEQDANESDNVEEYNSSDRDDDYAYDGDMDDVDNWDTPVYRRNEDNNLTPQFVHSETFHDFLNGQVLFAELTEQERMLTSYIIGNIDDDGYLRRSIDAMVDDIAFQLGQTVTHADIEKALKAVQTLDPPGVGARSLQECISLQLHRMPSTDSVNNAIVIVDKYFDKFSKKRFDFIESRMNIDEATLQKAFSEILKTNPKPGSAFLGESEAIVNHIIPDFFVENNNGELVVSLNNMHLPELHTNTTYQKMAQQKVRGNKRNREAITFARQKVEAANWFIDAIKQRNTTMMRTMEAIVQWQRDFFLTGDHLQMKPLKLRDVSDVVGYDVSTISRVTNSKFVQTEFGLFALKYFFNEKMWKKDGQEISNMEIKQMIVQIIQEEDKNNPVDDAALTQMLREKGYVVARRTVAKYREQLRLPTARVRSLPKLHTK